MLYGYAGKMLFVNLTDGSIEEKELSKELAEYFVGGYGFGAKILYEMMPAGVDPLGPENVMGFITGPTSATKAFFGGRYTIVHKSPVTGGWNDANSGGYFGPELKKAGYDALFISGASEKPVYLYIKDGKVEIRDASGLWGMDSKEVWEALKKETGEPRVRVTAIGPPGEKLALISCPINDGHRAPGRGGGGAVMGSKKLKAIAVRGTGEIPVANPEKVLEINKKIGDFMKTSDMAQAFGTFGTGVGTAASALSGDSPVKNWGGVGIVDFGEENAEKVTATTIDKYKTKKYNCSACPLGCGAEYTVNEGRWPMENTERPEYETTAAFGSTCLCGEADAILKCNEICNRYGFDTISAGMTVAWAMECYNNGVLSKEELDGIDLTWGNGEAMVELLQKMADGEGCGAVLANGSAYAAKHWGKGEELLQTASGIELPMHDPKYAPGLARTYKYDPTPGRHVKGGLGLIQMMSTDPSKYNYEDTGQTDLGFTTNTEVMNASSLCVFNAYAAPPEAQNEFLTAITGIEYDEKKVHETGWRIYLLRHAFNLREGLKPSDFTMTNRAVGDPPQTAGPLEGITVDEEKLSRNFFEAARIDMETGKPDKEILEELGQLDELVRDIYGSK
ncbi:aldehyde ferredoxin oxidoreductase family protein [Gudongella sp. SC589]|uniref:aldehyde ferredoxin oxidoreductase family protein n=1 Tax=Gudongella sp. SC589 TaxID=3385990 RepID=UPI0039046317